MPAPVVAFDFDGTLSDYMAADRAAVRSVHSTLHTDVSFDTFWQVSGEVIMEFHRLVAMGRVDPLTMHAWRLDQSCRRLGLPPCTAAQVELYRRTLVERTHAVPAALETLSSLFDAGVRPAVLTNAHNGHEQRQRIVHSLPEVDFECIVVAGEGSRLKPHREPFDRLLAALGVDADHVWYVGDSPSHDVPGALATGMRPVIVSPHSRIRRDARTRGARTISRIDELPGILA